MTRHKAFLVTFAAFVHYAWEAEGGLQREYARSGGAPNDAPSLRSVAGLLVAR